MVFTYLITGANRGIGLSIVEKLIKKDDVKVIATARSPAKATELKELANRAKNVEIVELDVSSKESIDKLGAQLEKVAPEGIDFFIGNAGVSGTLQNAIKISYEEYSKLFEVNVIGNVFVFKAVYPFLLKKDTRKVAFTSSAAGSLSQFFAAPHASYGISKAALNYLTKSLDLDHKDEGFTFVAIHPGVVKTEMSVEYVKFFGPGFEGLEPEESASLLVKVYDSITSQDSGKFFNYDGTEYPL